MITARDLLDSAYCSHDPHTADPCLRIDYNDRTYAIWIVGFVDANVAITIDAGATWQVDTLLPAHNLYQFAESADRLIKAALLAEDTRRADLADRSRRIDDRSDRQDGRDLAAELRHELFDPSRLVHALQIAKGARRTRDGVTILCPWHVERTASCSLWRRSDGTIAVHCFGCHVTADALGLIAQVRGLDVRRGYREVLREAALLARRYDILELINS